MAQSDQPKVRPVQLQLNNSGAWKTLCRFDAGDIEACGAATQGALLLQRADPAITCRIATTESLPLVLMHLDKSGAWRDA